MHVLRLVTDWSRRPSLTNGKDIVSFKISVIRKQLLQQKKIYNATEDDCIYQYLVSSEINGFRLFAVISGKSCFGANFGLKVNNIYWSFISIQQRYFQKK